MHRTPEPRTDPQTLPYNALTPDVVQDALAFIGLWGDGRLSALNSFENRVYQVHLETPVAGHAQVVAKFYRPGRWSDAQIAEEHAFSAELVAAEVPVVAPLAFGGQTLHHFGGFAFAVCPRRGGRRPELDDVEVLEWTGRFLARLHTVGAASAFQNRPALDSARFAREPRDWLLQHRMVAPEVQTAWAAALGEALALIEAHDVLRPTAAVAADGLRSRAATDPVATGPAALEHVPPHAPPQPFRDPSPHPSSGQALPESATGDEGCQPAGIRRLRLHGDCHPGNILWTPEGQPGAGPHFVDLDDARTGPAVQDLWMLLSGDRRQQTLQLSALLDGYEQFRAFDRRELALIEPLRTLRLIHYSAWLAMRWDDPAFPINFPWFGSRDYWQGQVEMLADQVDAMQQAPLVA